MKVTSKVNNTKLKMIDMACQDSLVLTGESLLSNLKRSQTMPFDIGTMQNQQTFVDSSEVNAGKVTVVTDAPQARRLYFHPEYKFQKGKNPNAGDMWFEPYINGNKKDYANKKFARHLRGKL